MVIAGSICSRDQVHLFSRCANKFVRITHDGKVLANDISGTPRKYNIHFNWFTDLKSWMNFSWNIQFNLHEEIVNDQRCPKTQMSIANGIVLCVSVFASCDSIDIGVQIVKNFIWLRLRMICG